MTDAHQQQTPTAGPPPGQGPPAASPAGQQAPPAGDEIGRDWAGVALDVAGVLAGAVLVVILIDVWTEGKLSGWWRRRRTAGQGAGGPAGDDQS